DTEKEKHFAVVDGGQGRFAVVVEDTAEKLQKFLYSYTKNPYEIEAIGICDKNGVIQKNGIPQMTNPNKFDSQWLDNKIRNQTRTLKDMFFKGKE
ncbi:MAG: hypothetical protein LBQ05_02595, partial [Christensenellaceae bacterium]|nr:hypothetical protein [Christensenellaceae bacterium]